jgi:hypothetical protein
MCNPQSGPESELPAFGLASILRYSESGIREPGCSTVPPAVIPALRHDYNQRIPSTLNPLLLTFRSESTAPVNIQKDPDYNRNPWIARVKTK